MFYLSNFSKSVKIFENENSKQLLWEKGHFIALCTWAKLNAETGINGQHCQGGAKDPWLAASFCQMFLASKLQRKLTPIWNVFLYVCAALHLYTADM